MAMIKNENLKKLMKKFKMENGSFSDDDFHKLLLELKCSNLMIAGELKSNSTINMLEDNGGASYALLFTDKKEFRKMRKIKKLDKAQIFPLEVYAAFLSDQDFDGYIINPASEEFILTEDAINLALNIDEEEFKEEDAYDGQKLKEIMQSTNNKSLENFLENPENAKKYDELINEMSASTLFTLMLAEKDLKNITHDGIIDTTSGDPGTLMHIENQDANYACLFTSPEKMSHIETSLNKFAEIVNTSIFVQFVLKSGMDGIIINPKSNNVILSKKVLKKHSKLISKKCNNEKLNNSIFFLFPLEGGI